MAERHPDDPYARRALARVALLRNDPAAARAALAPLVEGESQDVEALYLMGASYLTEARAGEASAFAEAAAPGRRYFARAFRLDATHTPTLYGYAETYVAGPSAMPDGPLDVLTQAHLLAPQVPDIRVRLGFELMRAGRFGEAGPVLAPVAYSPHQSALARQARLLLEAAQQGVVPSPEALAEAAQRPED